MLTITEIRMLEDTLYRLPDTIWSVWLDSLLEALEEAQAQAKAKQEAPPDGTAIFKDVIIRGLMLFVGLRALPSGDRPPSRDDQ